MQMYQGNGGAGDYAEHAEHWQVMAAPNTSSGGQVQPLDSATAGGGAGGQAGDSWVWDANSTANDDTTPFQGPTKTESFQVCKSVDQIDEPEQVTVREIKPHEPKPKK